MELISPLKARLETLAGEHPIRLASLKILLAHYRILTYLVEIEEKIELWRLDFRENIEDIFKIILDLPIL